MFSPSSPLQKFNSKEYYGQTDAYRDEKCPKKVVKSIFLFPKGMAAELVAQYYREKYGVDIAFFYDRELLIKFLETFHPKEDTRKAFVLIEGDEEPHANLIIYLREKGEEGLLFANSQGTSRPNIEYWGPRFKKPIYFVTEQRQLDYVACVADALVFSRDATGIDPATKNYIEPDLLRKLKLRAEEIIEGSGIYQVKLPNGLLKTSQDDSFVEIHRQPEDEKKADDKSSRFPITEFRKTHRDEGTYIVYGRRGRVSTLVNPSNYLRTQGFELANIVQIQFYVNQLAALLKKEWTEPVRKQFIENAETVLPEQPDLYDFTKTFLAMMRYPISHPMPAPDINAFVSRMSFSS